MSWTDSPDVQSDLTNKDSWSSALTIANKGVLADIYKNATGSDISAADLDKYAPETSVSGKASQDLINLHIQMRDAWGTRGKYANLDEFVKSLAGYDQAVESQQAVASASAGFKKVVKTGLETNLTDQLVTKFGVSSADAADLIKNNTELKTLIDDTKAGTFSTDAPTAISDQINTLETNRLTNLETTYSSKFFEKSGRQPTADEIATFVNSDQAKKLGLESLMTKDYAAGKNYEASTNTAIENTVEAYRTSKITPTETAAQLDAEGNPITGTGGTTYTDIFGKSVDATGKLLDASNTPSTTGYNADQVTQITTAAKNILGKEYDTLTAEQKNNLTTALTNYEESIKGLPDQYKSILQADFQRAIPEMTRQFGEYGVQSGLEKSGGLNQQMAEEMTKRQADIESQFAQYGMGQQSDIANKKLQLEQFLSDMESQKGMAVADLGYNIGAQNAQMKREDYLSNIGLQQQLALQQSQDNVKVYLNRLGFQQQLQASNLSYQNQLSMLSKQQGFESTQNSLNRDLQTRLAQMQIDQQNSLANTQNSAAKRNSWMNLAGGLGGAALGGWMGSLGNASQNDLLKQLLAKQY
jgi:hypothetical protein